MEDWNDLKRKAIRHIEEKSPLITETADRIWEYAELSLKEYRSADWYCALLEKEGFVVTKGIGGIETAFSANFGKGRPYIGLLAEYDALSGLSQKKGKTQKEPLESGRSGHGCGHNLLGAGALAAALGVKEFLSRSGSEGTVILYGCPGEEGGAAKAFMARDHVWEELDAALTWHPDEANEVVTGSSNACIQVQYLFHGIAAHASSDPDRGRSALDAVELMNLGVQFLREHMSDDARIHYAITDSGGVSPNVVQPEAAVLYMVRSKHVAEAAALQKRVDKIAEGAALMTETTFTRKFIDGTADTVTNHTLERLLYRNFEELGVPSYTEEEHLFADRLSGTYPGREGLPGFGAEFDPVVAKKVKELREKAGHAMDDFLLPLFTGEIFRPGSTDVGDVSWECPTAQIHVASWPNGCPGHSWQNVSCGGTSIGHKAAIHAGKVLCAAVIDLFTDPEILKEAKEEFKERTAGGYVCPIEEGAVPVIPEGLE
ncbi:MAG: amidohydrolase [Blautia sp.]|nr:amidohydrolase [Blautia sp.]